MFLIAVMSVNCFLTIRKFKLNSMRIAYLIIQVFITPFLIESSKAITISKVRQKL